MLKPDKNIQEILISTTSRFVGEFSSKKILITQAFPPLLDQTSINTSMCENPFSRNYYMIRIRRNINFDSELIMRKNIRPFYYDDALCIILAVLFGKRFDNHGFVQFNGSLLMPAINNNRAIAHFRIGPNSHSPRIDLKIPLNLEKIDLVKHLLIDRRENTKTINTFIAAGKFYLRSLQTYEDDIENAFLDLITCGEILSDYYSYTETQIYSHDNELESLFNTINKSNITDKKKIKNIIKNRLYSIARRYTLTILKLLNDNFYFNTESEYAYGALKIHDIEKRIKASYSLRSRYLHKGASGILHFMPIRGHYTEVKIGDPVVGSEEIKSLVKLSPTYIGMERIMRYCLLRFLHLNSRHKIHKDLED